MKNIRAFILALLITIGCSSTIIYTSCNKPTCSGVVCKNGGTCNKGACSCPSGYTGSFCDKAVIATVAYVNNTPTPIAITINGANATIPVGGTVSFNGSYGTVASGVASTSGSTSLGVTTGNGSVGQTITWHLTESFPKSGTVTDTLNVGASYFYLSIVNNSSHNIINYTVNSGLPAGSFAVTATVPNNGQTYGLGYYLAFANSNVLATYSDGSHPLLQTFSFPFVNNQAVVANFSN